MDGNRLSWAFSGGASRWRKKARFGGRSAVVEKGPMTSERNFRAKTEVILAGAAFKPMQPCRPAGYGVQAESTQTNEDNGDVACCPFEAKRFCASHAARG